MTRQTRPISWIKPARKEFERFPMEAQLVCLATLTIAAEGGKADIAKPLKGFGSGILVDCACRYMEMRFESCMPLKLEKRSGFFTHSRRNQRKESRLRGMSLNWSRTGSRD